MAREPQELLARAARRVPWLVGLSGASALVYESLWMRGFGLVFGSTNTAVALVLAVFMGGLTLGGALAARRRAEDPLAVYARLELAAGVAALLSLPLLRALPPLYATLASWGGWTGAVEAAGRGLLAALVVLPATVMLGASVPVAAAFLEKAGSDPRAGFGRLYLLNTLGGALGVALTGFLLLPALGVRLTLVAAATVSLTVGGLAWRWSRSMGTRVSAATAAQAPPPPERTPAASVVATLAFLSGAAVFAIEVLWTRSLTLVIGASAYAFDVMLSAVLLGIALGTLGYARWGRRVHRPLPAVGGLFAAAAALAVAGQWLIGQLPMAWFFLAGLLPVSFAAQQAAAFVLCLLVLLPVTAVLGVSFPLLLHCVPQTPGSAQRDAGRLCAWNTAGAIVGALGAHLVLVPRLGLQPPYLVCAGLLLAASACAVVAASGRRRLALLAPVACLLLLAPAVPRWKPWDPVLVSSGVYRYALQWQGSTSGGQLGSWLRSQRRLVFYEEGAQAVVAVAEPLGSGRRFLSVNGKTDAGSGVEDVVTQKLIAHVPMLLHSSPRRVLVVGWGAGATAASASLHGVDALECVEIEPAVWRAAPLFATLSGDVRDDPRFRMVIGDGRNHLLRPGPAYDVIVSEPSNPWISGVSNLFTREFYEIVLRRLGPSGVFGQWFHYYDLAPADVKVEVKTFVSVFPHASLWLVPPTQGPGGERRLGADLLLVGSREPQSLDWPKLKRAFADPRLGGDLRSTRVLADPLALVATWAMGRAEMERWASDSEVFPAGTPLNTDDYPYVELVAPRRNVVRPDQASLAASAQYDQMTAASGDVVTLVAGAVELEAGGVIAAGFLEALAERYEVAAQPERALRTALRAVSKDPASAAARARAGLLLLGRERPLEAEPHLAEAVRLDRSSARGWEGLGGLALQRGQYARAEEAQRNLLRLEPANVWGWLRLGAALVRQEKWVEALDAFETARSIDPAAPVEPKLMGFVRMQVYAEEERRRSGGPSVGTASRPRPSPMR